MKIKQSAGESIFYVINIILMALLVAVTLYPIVHVALSSISNPTDLMKHEGLILRPYGFSLDSYKAVFKNPYILSGYRNTLFVVAAGVLINLLLTSLGAYVLSRKHFFWNNIITFFIVFTMFFSGGLIPFFLNIKSLGIYNTLWAVILPVSINTFNLIIMRTSFKTIPDSMEESAKLDGAGHFTVLFRIILPLSKAVVAVIALYYGVAHWNAWFNAMILITDRDRFPLQVILREILIQNQTMDMSIGTAGEVESIGETIKYAIIMVATLPILTVYPFIQKYFVKGVMIGAVKE